MCKRRILKVSKSKSKAWEDECNVEWRVSCLRKFRGIDEELKSRIKILKSHKDVKRNEKKKKKKKKKKKVLI